MKCKTKNRFFGITAFQEGDDELPPRFVTELANIPSDVESGLHLLAINATNIVDTDAVPSRPTIWPVTSLSKREVDEK